MDMPKNAQFLPIFTPRFQTLLLLARYSHVLWDRATPEAADLLRQKFLFCDCEPLKVHSNQLFDFLGLLRLIRCLAHAKHAILRLCLALAVIAGVVKFPTFRILLVRPVCRFLSVT